MGEVILPRQIEVRFFALQVYDSQMHALALLLLLCTYFLHAESLRLRKMLTSTATAFFVSTSSSFLPFLPLTTMTPLPAAAVSGGGKEFALKDIRGQDMSSKSFAGQDFTQCDAAGANFQVRVTFLVTSRDIIHFMHIES